MSETFYRWQSGDLILSIKAIPGASVNKLEVAGERLKVKITSQPIDGKANKHLIKYLAKTFRVAASKISIEKGQNQGFKTLRIEDPRSLPEFIKAP